MDEPTEEELAIAVKLDGLAETAKKLAAVLRGEQVDWTGRGLKVILFSKLDGVRRIFDDGRVV